MTARKPASTTGAAVPGAVRGSLISAEERLNRCKIDRNDCVGDFAMRFTMDSLGGGRIGCVDETKGGAAILVEPIGHVFDAVSVLDVDIPAVGLGHLL